MVCAQSTRLHYSQLHLLDKYYQRSLIFCLYAMLALQVSPADSGQNKRIAVSSARGINIDMLQWPGMLIKYMLIEIQ